MQPANIVCYIDRLSLFQIGNVLSILSGISILASIVISCVVLYQIARKRADNVDSTMMVMSRASTIALSVGYVLLVFAGISIVLAMVLYPIDPVRTLSANSDLTKTQITKYYDDCTVTPKTVDVEERNTKGKLTGKTVKLTYQIKNNQCRFEITNR